MLALIMAAGTGRRLAGSGYDVPKVLLRFGGRSLLERHVTLLERAGVDRLVVATGYGAQSVERELARLSPSPAVQTVHNPAYHEGSMVTLWQCRAALESGEDVLLMDADVLYDARLLAPLLGSPHRNCLLIDRGFEPGEEPVKVCVREGRAVELRKQIDPELVYDYEGESVGFFRLSGEAARHLAAIAGRYVRRGLRGAPHEEALRDLVRGEAGGPFGFEDVTGLPWIEIDFPEDVRRAGTKILSRLMG
ncbi:MAG: phosphocholine cytidylyltransferase family protein [Gammaproteobacteria bacterium]|nr:phosphocholine cytidylyltransferase family protein [Gammaproteobacteria bacterium]NIR83046.1 phosphocholine cytidylyltransferase family protein [Gammaproteobacteria bacterium]NIR90708.1 phosphocholine cytidylyltransferase family protein [Gammaproteobacteria bacterium]NIU04199.1 phosphocholine cytidylyltransferase family protein [Gammaproteobacteria bacterium]NIV51491.1 NTP transferase domain-containing protein [Gammaproteobacteria bacterium]